MISIKAVFWISLFLVIYPHLIYPALIAFLARYFPIKIEVLEYSDEWPTVTFIISAFNEEQVLDAKLKNATEMNYPKSRLKIMVISDASDDDTDAIVKAWAKRDNRVVFHRQEQRLGKSMGLNAGIEKANSELLVFSDANAMYQKNALKELVKNFNDEKVGYVVGAALYNKDYQSGANQSEDLYWNLEIKLKYWESKFYSVVGGDGAIYAIRRELFWELEADDINDFVNPLKIVSEGYVGLFNPNAICYEDTAEEFGKEFKRKRRIVNRSWRGFRKSMPRFSFRKHGRFLFSLYSHKVIRWFALVFLLGTALSAGFLALTDQGVLYSAVFITLIGSMIVALIASYCDQRGATMPKIVYLCYYFYFVNYSAILGILDNAMGVRHITWDHIRGEKQGQ
jgi:cellulose synthase/poly-beta-1,6-N-acetylglucosamine synthase-like glycosyltransferase